MFYVLIMWFKNMGSYDYLMNLENHEIKYKNELSIKNFMAYQIPLNIAGAPKPWHLGVWFSRKSPSSWLSTSPSIFSTTFPNWSLTAPNSPRFRRSSECSSCSYWSIQCQLITSFIPNYAGKNLEIMKTKVNFIFKSLPYKRLGWIHNSNFIFF